MFDSLLIALGVSSPIILSSSVIIFFVLKNIFENKIEIYKEMTLEKFKNEMILKNAEYEHNLAIEFDKVRIIHDRQKEVLTSILEELNGIVVDIFDSYSYEKSTMPLFPDMKLKKAKKKIYSNGLFVNSDSLILINIFFDVLQNNTDWIFDAVGNDESHEFNKFDLRLMELILNELFGKFRMQMGIEPKESHKDYTDMIEILSIVSRHKYIFNKEIYRLIFARSEDLYQVLNDMKDDILIGVELKKSIDKNITKENSAIMSKEDMNKLVLYCTK